MKLQILRKLMLIALLLTSNAIWAYDFESGGIYYNITSSENKTVEVTYSDINNNSYSGEVIIPATVTLGENSYSVTSIRNEAFYECSGLTSVTIPNSVTSIERYAFYGCSSLTSVTIPNSVTSIGEYTFYNCSGLTSVTIPNSVTSIGEYTFYNCRGLTSVTIPNSVTSIGGGAFSQCSGLTSVTIPNSVTSIGNSAFNKCSGLTSVTIPNSVTSIGNFAFWGCSGLTSVTIPNSVTSIENAVFSGCSGLTSVTIPNSVTSIGIGAFDNCTGLTSVTIPEGVTSIGGQTFYNCSGLTYIELPSTITSIGGSAFAISEYYYDENGNYNYRDNITRTIKCNAKTPPTLGSDYIFAYNYLTLEVPFESIPDYQAIEWWSKNSYGSITYKSKEVDGIYYLPTSKTEVAVTYKDTDYNSPDWYISDYTGDVVFPSEITVDEKKYNVTSIGNHAFYSCSGLTSVTIPNSVTSIGQSAFYNCSGLTSVTIPNSVTSIGHYAFYKCSGLTNITIPNSVTSIGGRAFYNCSGLTSVTIPEGIISIDGYAFYDCNNLTYIELPSTITSIGGSAFAISHYYYDENGNYIYRGNINRTIKCNAKIPPTIVNNVFHCNYLTLEVPFESIPDYKAVEAWTTMEDGSITYKSKEIDGIYYLPTSKSEVAVTYKDKNYNSYTSDVAIPDTIMVDSIKYNVTSIGERAFYSCNKLNGKLSLPSSITSIGEYAFSGTKYSICEIAATTPPAISSSSLSAETSLVLVPKGTPNAYKAADVWKNYTIIAEGSCDIEVTNATGGELAKSILTQTRKNLQNITGLKVKGTLNSIDLELINTNMSSLLHLDITETDVTEIPTEAFKDVVTLMSIKLPSTLQTIGDYAFSGCKVLSGELILPEKLTKIGNYAFQNCSGLSGTLKIPANVTYINSYAFSGCYDIKNIDMTGATKLYEIGNNAFRGCTTIESVDMAGASRLINLGTYVFSGCTGLKSVDMTGAKSLTSLSSYIFNGCNSLETVLFPETLETIGNYSFYNCAKLDNLKLPAALKSINSSAFNYCTGMKSIDMTEAKSMTSLTSYLFSDLYSLETVLFPETLETIGSNTFYNCTKLNNVKLPAALKSIDSSAFYGCAGMTSIDFSACSSLTTIYGSAFYGCTGLTMLDLSACESLITIKDSAFSGCSALATINFPISLVSIGSNAFAQCTNLLQLSVPCTIPPVIENHAEPFAGVDNIACILSIPSDNFFDYYSANYWGGFVDVDGKSEVQNGVNDATDEEDGEGEGDSAGEGDETGKHKKHKGCKVRFKKHHKGGHSPRLMALKGVNTLAETEDVSNTSDLGFTGDGQSLFVGFGESVTYYLTPEEGKEIESVYFNDEDVTSQLVNNTLTVTVTSDMTMTSFVVNMKNASPKLAGDVNGDGEVNVTDVVKLYSYILGNTTDINESAVDLNGDGEVNVSDIVKLYSIILSSN